MIKSIANIITNPTLVNVAQSTNGTVASKTIVNSIGRPGFILIDNNISPETKKFAATKEFLYQACCLAVYMAVIIPIFKKGGFKLAKEKIFKNTNGFEHFDNFREYIFYRKLADNSQKANRLASLEKTISHKNCKVKDMYNNYLLNELNKDNPDKFVHVKGAVELSNLTGSIIGLAVIAPNVSQWLIHPFLKLLGMDDKHQKQGLDTNI